MIEQRSQAWHEQRVGKITGSRIGTILGHNPYQTRAQLMRAMVREAKGAPSEFVVTADVQRGVDREASSLMTLKLETGIDFKEAGFIQHPKYDWIGVSPDALADTCGAEIKNPRKPQPLIDKPNYEAQIRLCMECCDMGEWYYFSDPVEGDHIIELVNRQRMWFNGVLPALHDFMDEYQSELSNPAHLEPLVEAREDDEFCEAASLYLAANRRLKAAQDDEKAAREALLSLTDKSCSGGGVLVSKITRQGAVNNKKIYSEFNIDPEKYRGKSTTYFSIKEQS